ncbi:hypothetical protein NW739_02640 [Mycoplasmopsis felis]|uniref:hypothetical protein n=1 Tax=Mycoplasmopsis felis TaxID=33923 RepID=UPI0021E0E810|nr:hypothetical protein [Mycoplasmopsis felis]MCU9939671.1 hypothetical protein [Mycoplasmopsis felis]
MLPKKKLDSWEKPKSFDGGGVIIGLCGSTIGSGLIEIIGSDSESFGCFSSSVGIKLIIFSIKLQLLEIGNIKELKKEIPIIFLMCFLIFFMSILTHKF